MHCTQFTGKCTDLCFWHEKDEKSTFGPFLSNEAISVINSFCIRWSDPSVVLKYIRSDTTNFVEYVNSLEGLFNLKIKHNTTKESYDLIAFYASAMVNKMNVSIESNIIKELGLPWENKQEQLLNDRLKEFTSNQDRKNSEEYKARRSELVQIRKYDSIVGKNDDCYKSVESAQKHLELVSQSKKRTRQQIIDESPNKLNCPLCKINYLPPLCKHCSKKKKKKLVFEPGELVFVKFATICHYGVILETELINNMDYYKIYFLDKDTQSLEHSELKKKVSNKSNCWIPNAPSVNFEKFKIDKFGLELTNYYIEYTNK
jgi:hypothetical protein